MSFIQCKNENEVEKYLHKQGNGFVTPDFKIYQKMELYDEYSVHTVDADTWVALYNLQTHIEMLKDGTMEIALDDLVSQAKDFKKSFNAALQAIKFKPMEKKKRGI